MEIIVLLISLLLIFAGIIGIIAPILPSTILVFGGIFLYAIVTNFTIISTKTIIIFAILTILSLITDYLSTIWGAKKFGASKAGIYGALIGTILGFFLIAITGFLSIIIFPFLGAVLGELIIGKTRREALSAGLGTLIGFIFGTVFKIVISFAMTGYFIYNLIASY